MALACLCLAAGCASPVKGLFPAPPGQVSRTVDVLYYKHHTGVIFRAADIPAGVWPEHCEFPDAEYLEVGWGDIEGYRYPLTVPIALRSMFDSEGSILLIHAFSGSITNEYAGFAKKIFAVQLSGRGFGRLCAYVQNTYALDPSGRPIPIPSFDSGENFFLAGGHYSVINNCNNWTARALREAGCPMRPGWSFLPGIVMSQCRRFGREIWPKPQSEKTALVPTRSTHELSAEK